jgi:Trypsin-like peptidase domain
MPPADRPEYSICEIFRGDRAVGLGFAISRAHVVTCAHVVNSALGRSDKRDPARPGDALAVRLRFAIGSTPGDDGYRAASVAGWLPAGAGTFDADDVAVLELAEPAPAHVRVLHPARYRPLMAVQMWGPQPGRPGGGHVKGELLGEVRDGRIQVRVNGGPFRVRPGFSGGPVWEPGSGGAAGVLSAYGAEDDATDAYLLGTDRIAAAWPGWPQGEPDGGSEPVSRRGRTPMPTAGTPPRDSAMVTGPQGGLRRSMAGAVRNAVRAGHVGSLVTGRSFGRRGALVLILAAVLILGAGTGVLLLVQHRAGQAGDQAVSRVPLAAVVITQPVPCRSGWVVPDHGQHMFPDVPGQQPAGAVLSSGSSVIVTVQGVAGRTVVLQSMTVVVAHRAPSMAGIYLPAGCQEELVPRKYELNLDSPAPRVVPEPGNTGFPYTITNDDPEQFIITPDVASGDVEWFLYLTWTSGASEGRLVLNDSGRPFRTTATTAARQFCLDFAGEWTSAC